MADVRGPRLLADLNSAFKRDPDIDEYDTIPVLEAKHNRSPFILQNHKLGVESWAVKILVKYSATRLKGWRHHHSGEHLTDHLEVCSLSRALLLFCPEVYSAWNIRKELIDQGYLSLSDDLAFGALILSKHPNSSETYTHRRWLFRQLLDHSLSSSSGSVSSTTASASNNCFVNMDAIDVDLSCSAQPGLHENGVLALESSRLVKSHVQKELRLCSRAAEKYSCNYHAWSHRIWIMQHCLNCSLEALLPELKVTESWTSQHISDYSGFHYRQFLLSELTARQGKLAAMCPHSSTDLLVLEMAFVCDLINTFPGHEALWCHRRFLFATLLKSNYLEVYWRLNSSIGKDSQEVQIDATDVSNKRSFYISQEVEKVTQQSASSAGYEQTLVQKYVSWLRTL